MCSMSQPVDTWIDIVDFRFPVKRRVSPSGVSL